MISYCSECPSSKKSINNKCWGGCGEKGTPLHGWWKGKLTVTTTVEKNSLFYLIIFGPSASLQSF